MTRLLQACTWSGLLIATTVAVGLTMMARGDSPEGKVVPRKAPDKTSLSTGDFKGGDVGKGGIAGGVCSSGGCTESTTLYPSTLFSTTSADWTTFTTCAYAGEHSRFSVVAGHTYEWTSCSADGADCVWDSQFMLRDTAGNNLCYNDDFCGLQSKIEWTATFTGEVHLARMEYFCGTNTECATLRWRCASCGAGVCGDPGAGDCCVDNGTPGCDDATCCAAICAIDSYCCDTSWDGLCADEAAADPVNCPQCAPGPPNDNCGNAVAIFNGATAFSNIGATTDGPPHAACLAFGDDQVGSDIWFNYDATFTGDLTVSLCGSAYDTKLAVYDGCGCPVGDGNLLACNDDFCGLQSEVTVPVVSGNCYKLRVGGYSEAQGDGTITITKTTPCGDPAAGDCCVANGTPGCDDATCCDAICAIDPFCCDSSWDGLCADEAAADPVNCPQCAPSAPNDLCANALPIFNGDTTYDMTGAGTETSSTCFGPVVDIFYDYTADFTGLATFSVCGTADYTGIEVYEGCACPFTGNTFLACDSCGTVDGSCFDSCRSEVTVPVVQGQCYKIWIGQNVPVGTGTITITKDPGPSEVNFFFDQGPFEDAVAAAGKLLKGIEDFEEANVPDGTCSGMDDPLDANTDNGIFFPGDILCNLAFQSNLDSPGVNGPNPRGLNGIAVCGPGAGQGSVDKAVSANFFADSTDILSLNPNHTAMALRIADIGNTPGPIEVRVFDKNEVLLGGTTVATTLPGTFIGFVMKDQQTFGRVNLSSTGPIGTETIYVVMAYVTPNLSPCPWDLDGDNSVGILDLLALLAAWGPNPGDPANFDGDCSVGILDLLALLAHWGPCPPPAACAGPFECGGILTECGPGDPCFCFHGAAGDTFCGDATIPTCDDLVPCPGGEGDCPPGFRCAVLTCCPEPICFPECVAAASAAPEVRPVPPGTMTFTGVADENPLTTGKN